MKSSNNMYLAIVAIVAVVAVVVLILNFSGGKQAVAGEAISISLLPCSDSDGGWNINDPGKTINRTRTHIDYCLNTTTVLEGFCEGNAVRSLQGDCGRNRLQCSKGECV
ncbi:MAG: hypothetical protein Q8R37_01805 [Nanoarchaeota archaeon]|nr:hypothetical protein [Nanoarchaeota archaeon]